MCSHTQSDPKRVKKALPKILKTLKPEHRVQIIGVTSAPFSETANRHIHCIIMLTISVFFASDADVKPLCNMYPRQILVQRPDYASRYGVCVSYVQLLWLDLQCSRLYFTRALIPYAPLCTASRHPYNPYGVIMCVHMM